MFLANHDKIYILVIHIINSSQLILISIEHLLSVIRHLCVELAVGYIDQHTLAF